VRRRPPGPIRDGDPRRTEGAEQIPGELADVPEADQPTRASRNVLACGIASSYTAVAHTSRRSDRSWVKKPLRIMMARPARTRDRPFVMKGVPPTHRRERAKVDPVDARTRDVDESQLLATPAISAVNCRRRTPAHDAARRAGPRARCATTACALREGGFEPLPVRHQAAVATTIFITANLLAVLAFGIERPAGDQYCWRRVVADTEPLGQIELVSGSHRVLVEFDAEPWCSGTSR